MLAPKVIKVCCAVMRCLEAVDSVIRTQNHIDVVASVNVI